jgi:16S rRNA (cytosine967-C5)-methyltransferase
MPLSPARRLAYRVLRRVESSEAYAADLLRAAGSRLSEADRRLATELALGTLRRRAELDFWIERLSGRPLAYFDLELLIILRLGVYQIRYLSRIPKSAAVNECVELVKTARKRSAAGLVNAVLRKCEAARDGGRGDYGVESLRLALPEWLRERWAVRFGSEAALALARWSLTPPAAIVRVSDGRSVDETRNELAAEGIEAVAARFATQALQAESGVVLRSRLLKERRMVIQEEASQIVGALAAPMPGQQVLDLCAAPGMKTLQLAETLGRGLLVSCDRSMRRLSGVAPVAAELIPNGVRWARVRLDASQPLPFGVEFDRILLDAPCSGTGTLARNPEIKWRLAPGDITRLAGAQARMLGTALRWLAPRGRLVYATCSLEPEESEQVVETALAGWIGFRPLDRTELAAQFPQAAPLFDRDGFLRTRPDLHGTDGFFASVIERQ